MNLKVTTSLIAGVANAGVAFTVDGDLALAVSALVGTVTITLAVISWIDGRIDSKIKPLQEKLDKLDSHFFPQDQKKKE